MPGPIVLALTCAASLLEASFWLAGKNKEIRLFLLRLAYAAPFASRWFVVAVIQFLLLLPFLTTTIDSARAVRSRAGVSGDIDWESIQAGFADEESVNVEVASATGPVGRDLHGRPFVVDASPASLAWKPKTISVILPCAEEREFALKTVRSVFEQTPSEVLKEIIVVDDGSYPPLSQTHLTPEVQEQYRTKVIRHDTTIGLIGAKKTGGDAASGDISVFFDCHVAPQPGWHRPFLRLIGENWRRLVVPQITALDIDTWTQMGAVGGMSKCYLTWDADFKWFESSDNYVAVISGGLLGMSRRWWYETGGYDEHMLGWGGENLDQSLRIWLCGGEIVTATDSYVAHMWRGNDWRTAARYWKVGDTSANRARAVYAWYGEFAEKLNHYPSFSWRNWWSQWYGDLTPILQVKERLRCRPFAWFLRRFKGIYEDAGLLPNSVFMLRDEESQRCLRFNGYAGTSSSGVGTASLASCDRDNDHRLFWHLGNRDRNTGRCCSGLRAWNTDQCLEGAEGNNAKTGVCDVAGRNYMQDWAVSPATGKLHRRGECLSVQNGNVLVHTCGTEAQSRWTKVSSYVPLETELYRKAQAEQPEVFKSVERQLTSSAKVFCDTVDGGCFRLYRRGFGNSCLDKDAVFIEDESACGVFVAEDKLLRLLGDAMAMSCLSHAVSDAADMWTLKACRAGGGSFELRGGEFCDAADRCLRHVSA